MATYSRGKSAISVSHSISFMDKKETICYFTFQRPGQALLKDYSFSGGGYVTIAEIFFLKLFLACKGKVYISVLYHSVTHDTNTRAVIELSKANLFVFVSSIHQSVSLIKPWEFEQER